MAIQKIILHDTFTGTNSVELSAHVPDKYERHIVPTWATLTGHTIPQIQSNASSATADATNNSEVIDLGRKHVQIETNIVSGSGTVATNWIALILRCVDVNNYIQVKVGEVSSAVYQLQINNVVAGSSTTWNSRTATWAEATEYNLKVRCVGNLVYVQFSDGGADLEWQMNEYCPSGTLWGIWHYIAATSSTYPLVNDIKILG